MLSCEFGSTHSGTRQTRAPIRADERGAAQEHSVRAAPGPAQLISAARSRQPVSKRARPLAAKEAAPRAAVPPANPRETPFQTMAAALCEQTAGLHL